MSIDATQPARYRFGDSARSGLLLGLSLRQCMPLGAGVVWLTLWLVVRQPIVGVAGAAAVVYGAWVRPRLARWARPMRNSRAVSGCRAGPRRPAADAVKP